jgi:formate dehydrogenase subunit delta
MNIDHMVKMANEISAFFISESKPGDAPREVAAHLRRYWEPRMRKQIIAHYRDGAAGLEDVARDAIGILAAAEAAPKS